MSLRSYIFILTAICVGAPMYEITPGAGLGFWAAAGLMCVDEIVKSIREKK